MVIFNLAPTDRSNDSQETYQTYTRYNPKTGQCYSGRTSGNDTPEENVRRRGKEQKHLNDEGFDAPKLDRSTEDDSPSSYWKIRGREQQMIEYNGGAQSMDGESRNKINGISPFNPLGTTMKDMATAQWGEPSKNTRNGKCYCN